MRTYLEVSLLAMGVALRGTADIRTVVYAITIRPIIKQTLRLVDRHKRVMGQS